MHAIYEIRFEGSDKRYIGSAVDLDQRVLRHRGGLRRGDHPNPHLLNAFRKHGEDSMSFNLVEEVTEQRHLIAREQFHIDSHEWDMLYNLSPTAGSQLGSIQSPAMKNRMSEIVTQAHADRRKAKGLPPFTAEESKASRKQNLRVRLRAANKISHLDGGAAANAVKLEMLLDEQREEMLAESQQTPREPATEDEQDLPWGYHVCHVPAPPKVEGRSKRKRRPKRYGGASRNR